MVACPGVGEPLTNLSLSLSLLLPSPLSLARYQLPTKEWQRPGGSMALAWGRGRAHSSTTIRSPAIPCPSFCRWGCGKAWAGLLAMRGSGAFPGPLSHDGGGIAGPGPDSPGAAPDQAGQYQIPVSIKGGTYQALVDSGCNQTSIHQSLMQQRALDMSRKVKVRCVHGDVADYPLVPVSIKFRGKTHRMEVAVNPHLKHPLILGTDWPAFTQLLGIVCADVSWQTGRGQEEAAAQAGEALAGPSPPVSEETRASEGVKPPELDDFPLEQSRDEALKNAFDRVRSVDGQLLQPDVPFSFPYFALIK